MGTGEGGVARYPRPGRKRGDRLDQPNVEELIRIPPAQVLQTEVLGFQGQIREVVLDPVDPVAGEAIGIAVHQAKFYFDIYAGIGIKIALVPERLVDVVDAGLHHGIGDVLWAIVVDDVDHGRNGEDAATPRRHPLAEHLVNRLVKFVLTTLQIGITLGPVIVVTTGMAVSGRWGGAQFKGGIG